ncbi:hypothetical protein ACO0LO_22960 [Undibacterium sp. TJN25]|uniref:hypothetical protein n=1 Tax=Undibacterium sp. TJN25 TaxID=3413056 RepID=UPI003BF3DE66
MRNLQSFTVEVDVQSRTKQKIGAMRGRALALLGGLTASLAAAAQTPPIPESLQSAEMRMSGDRVTLPIVMVREFPFVEGSIAGVAGKLLLDTGAQESLTVNSHRVPVADSQSVGVGRFGSGQTYVEQRVPVVRDIRVAGLRYGQVTHVDAQDATQLEHITPDFIGWIGYYFWDGYALKLDYRNLQASFYRGSSETYLSGEKLIAALPFELRLRQNIPVMSVHIGDLAATAAFDTGQYGALYVDAATKSNMIQAGLLTNPGDDDTYDLTQLKINGQTFPDIKGIAVYTDGFPPAKSTGLVDKVVLTIGYGWLKNYKTVWDSQRKTIYVLEK